MRHYNYDISIITPLYNEERNIEEQFNHINRALSELGRSFEVIFVNDGSTDGSAKILAKLHNEHKNVTIINLYRKKGKAAALEVGIEFAKGKYIATMDSDLQYDAHDIPPMIRELDKGYDFVSGRRIEREDSKIVIVTSRIFNMIMRSMTRLNFVDYFSGLKCFNRDVIDYLSLYGDLYRFASVYAFKQGFKVTEIPIKHYHRTRGISKYNTIKRLGMALLDIIVVLFTVTFNQNRIYYIGVCGLLLLSAGIVFLFSPALFSYNQELVLSGHISPIGIVLIFFGIQALILKKMSKDYFDRHQKEYFKRKTNVKNILARKNNRESEET